MCTLFPNTKTLINASFQENSFPWINSLTVRDESLFTVVNSTVKTHTSHFYFRGYCKPAYLNSCLIETPRLRVASSIKGSFPYDIMEASLFVFFLACVAQL